MVSGQWKSGIHGSTALPFVAHVNFLDALGFAEILQEYRFTPLSSISKSYENHIKVF